MDRDFILKQAKKIMLKDGGHVPLVIVVTEDQSYALPALRRSWDSNAFGRKKLLFALGRAFAQDECLTSNDFLKVYLVHEAWFVKGHASQDVFAALPSESPNRRECLGILEMILDQASHTIDHAYLMVEVLRHGGIVDLGPCEEIKEVRSDLLLSFLAGVASADYNDEEFGEVIKRCTEVGER